MPPRLNLLGTCRALALRPRRPAASWQHSPRSLSLIRGYADVAPKVPPTAPLPTSQQPPARASSSPSAGAAPASSFSHADDDADVALSTLRAGQEIKKAEDDAAAPTMSNEEALRQLEMISYGVGSFDSDEVGHKYGVPELPIPSNMHMKYRYDPVVEQITNLLMRHGKKSKAQRDMAMVLNFLRTMPAPRYSSAKRLMPGAPPASHLPLDPVAYLTLAIDSVAPLILIRNVPGIIGGGKSLPLPHPLSVRQRRRWAFKWILEVVNKKQSKGSGRTQLASRIADEIHAVVEGRSSVWDKRQLVHKVGTASRAHVVHVGKKIKPGYKN